MSRAATNRTAHAGATAFFKLLHDLRGIPGVRVLGKRPDEDDSVIHGFDAGQEIIVAALEALGFTATDTEHAGGFAAALSWYLLPELDSVSSSLGDDPAEDAARALLDVATARLGTPLAADAEAPAAGSPSARAEDTAPTTSAQSNIHDSIRVETSGPPAVIFNPAAGVPDLLSYVHGQLVILDEALRLLDRAESDNGLGSALVAVLQSAMRAVEIACAAAEGRAA
jgi:hypothetical protein